MITKRIFTNADVIEMLQDVLEIVAAVDPPDELKPLVFNVASNMVGHREAVSITGTPGFPIVQR